MYELYTLWGHQPIPEAKRVDEGDKMSILRINQILFFKMHNLFSVDPLEVPFDNEFNAIVERDGERFIAYYPAIPGTNGQGRTK